MKIKPLISISFLSTLVAFPRLLFAQTFLGDCPPGTFCNPFGGIRSIPELIETIANNVILPIGAVIVVVMVIYSGFLFVTAQGNESKLSDAKKAITYTVIGAVILLGSWVIANVITETVCLLYEDPPAGLGCGSSSGSTADIDFGNNDGGSGSAPSPTLPDSSGGPFGSVPTAN